MSDVPYLYHDATGRITQVGFSHPRHLETPLDRPGETLLIGQQGDFDTDYIGLGPDGQPTVLRRPPMYIDVSKTTIVANGTDAVVFSELPLPCTVYIDDGQFDQPVNQEPPVITQDDLDENEGWSFAAADPGIYTLVFERFPLMPYTIAITATAP